MSEVGTQRGLMCVWRGLALAIALALSPCRPVHAEDNPVSEGWSFQLAPYMWFIALDGDVTVRGQDSSVDLGFDDILKKLNIAAMIQGEARHGRFGLFAMTTYAELSDDASGAVLQLDADVTTFWLEGGAYYRLGPWVVDERASGKPVTATLDPYIGVRYTYLDLKLDFKPGPHFSGDQDWVDPIVGARTIWELSDRWSVTAFGDIGGFNVGSDFSWQAAGLVGYSFSLFGDNDARVLAGYRALHQDYKNGSGADEFKWDVTLHGPVAALAVHF